VPNKYVSEVGEQNQPTGSQSEGFPSAEQHPIFVPFISFGDPWNCFMPGHARCMLVLVSYDR
jgi:hypothetical protein